MRVICSAPVFAGAILVSGVAAANVVTIGASRDNSNFSEQPTGSNGIGDGIYVGETADSSGTEWRRGLIGFDIASAVPAGSTINSVSMTLYVSKSSQSTAMNVNLYRVLKNWGEGTSDAINNPIPGGGSGGGGGAAATNGDATWTDAVYNAEPGSAIAWTKPGGDFSGTSSGVTTITFSKVTYTWTSATMAADVQSWLNSPSTNYGWLLQGNETALSTARRFESRESTTPGLQPALVISFTPAPEPTSLALIGVAALGLTARRRKI
jgi:hypothetical protein